MDALLHAHLLDVVAADFPRAQQHLQRWRRSLTRHIAIENHQLLPHVPANARWPARMYLLEHERIELLADEYAMRVDALAARAPWCAHTRRGGAHAARCRTCPAPPAGAPPPARGDGAGAGTAARLATSGLAAARRGLNPNGRLHNPGAAAAGPGVRACRWRASPAGAGGFPDCGVPLPCGRRGAVAQRPSGAFRRTFRRAWAQPARACRLHRPPPW